MVSIFNKDFRNFTVDFLIWLTMVILVIGALAAIAFQVEAILFRFPLDYGEGPLVNQAVQFNAKENIYKPDLTEPPFTIANYPPVFVIIMAVFEAIWGPAFWYGRLIASISAVGSSALIAYMSYSYSNRIRLGLISGFLFLNIPYVVGWSTLARIDHLALFLALAGLSILICNHQKDRLIDRSILLASLFFVLAIYTRQSYALAAPLAGFLYLYQNNWKKGFLLITLVGGTSLLLFLVLNFLTGGGFYFNIVTANINPFGFSRMIDNFQNFFELLPLVFILAAFSLGLTFRQVSGWPLVLGLTFGGLLSAVTIGKIGSNVNYFLEFSAALCLLIGIGVGVIDKKEHGKLLWCLLSFFLLALAWQSFKMVGIVQNQTRSMLEDRKVALEELEKLENLVQQNASQPILADEYMGLIVLSGEGLYLQPFELTQLANANLWDQEILVDQINDELFSLILLQELSWWEYVVQERWTPEMIEAVGLNYRLVAQLENTNVYQPRKKQIFVSLTECPAGLWPLPTQANLGLQYIDGLVVFYGSGVEGSVPVRAPADGEVYRPIGFPPGSLVIVHKDPFLQRDKVITLFGDMRSSRGHESLIAEEYPLGASGVLVAVGDLIGYQSMWSGTVGQKFWLHVDFGVAPYDEQYLEDFNLLLENLVNPAEYFGISIDPNQPDIRPVVCVP